MASRILCSRLINASFKSITSLLGNSFQIFFKKILSQSFNFFLLDIFPKNVYVGEHRRSTTGDTAEKVHQVCKYEIHEDYDSYTYTNDIGKKHVTRRCWDLFHTILVRPRTYYVIKEIICKVRTLHQFTSHKHPEHLFF